MKKAFKNSIVYVLLFSMLAVFISGCDVDPVGENGAGYLKPGDTYTPSNPVFKLEKDEYSFDNSSVSFGYGKDYKIPVKRYKQVFGDLRNDIPENITDKLQEMSPWGGSCLGMAVTAKLFNIGFIKYSDFIKDATCTHDFKAPKNPSSSVTELIEKYQIYQEYGQEVIDEYIYSPTKPAEILKIAIDGAMKGEPVVIEVRGDMGGACGHALLPYRFEGQPGSICKVYVYDCNEPDNQNKILTIDTANNTWKYQLFSDDDIFWGSGEKHSKIYIRRISAFKKKPTPLWCSNVENKTYLYVSNASSVDIKSSRGIVKYEDGEMVTDIERAYLIPISAVSKEKRGGCSTRRFLLPSDKYDVTFRDNRRRLKANPNDIMFMGNDKILLLEGINNLTPISINPLKGSIYIKPNSMQKVNITIYSKKIDNKSIGYTLKGQINKNSDIDISLDDDDSIKVKSDKLTNLKLRVLLPDKRIIKDYDLKVQPNIPLKLDSAKIRGGN